MKTYNKETLGGVALVGRMVARPGKREELLRFLEEMVGLCGEHEPVGALAVTVHSSPANSDMVVLYEHYPDLRSLDEHRANFERVPAYGEARRRLSELLASPIEIVEVARPVVGFTRSDGMLRGVTPAGYARVESWGVAWIARFLAKEGKRQELLDLLEESVAPQAEYEADPALAIVLHTSGQNPDLVMMYKHYPSCESMEEHHAPSQVPLLRELGARFTELLAEPFEVIEVATPFVRFARAVTPKVK